VKENELNAAAEFARLVEIVDCLRAPGGCPWDREQTHQSLRAHLIEETSEVLEAIDLQNDASLCEELGDVMLQPVMHARIAAEENRFSIADVLHDINEKLVRRHPHVFGDREANTAEEVLKNWDAIKRAEKGGDKSTFTSRLDSVAGTLPALMLANKISKKAARAGFEFDDTNGPWEKMREEIEELQQGIANDDHENIYDEIGDVLFTVVQVARWHKVDPELALRDTVTRFKKRFELMEQSAAAKEIELEALSPTQWDEMWNAAKKELEPQPEC
jgi:tetrapyrrole methylase family protein/MazG family protein